MGTSMDDPAMASRPMGTSMDDSSYYVHPVYRRTNTITPERERVRSRPLGGGQRNSFMKTNTLGGIAEDRPQQQAPARNGYASTQPQYAQQQQQQTQTQPSGGGFALRTRSSSAKPTGRAAQYHQQGQPQHQYHQPVKILALPWIGSWRNSAGDLY